MLPHHHPSISANNNRLIIYFPVSALVTLFANILQNPQDPRARSDVKLMNLVVNFLTMLSTDEENSSIKRMLGVCAEFERIAKVVLDRTDKESSSRRKRKSPADRADQPAQQVPTSMTARSPFQAHAAPPATPGKAFTPNYNGDMHNQVGRSLPK